MGRLFTFGCSFTKYIYPTWADFIGTQFDTHQNWGKSGAGNFFIYSQLLECNQLNNINKDDTVLIMLSGYVRFDIIDRESKFITCGNMYNQKFFDEDFVYNKWSEEYAFYSTWVYVNSIINLSQQNFIQSLKTFLSFLLFPNLKNLFIFFTIFKNFLKFLIIYLINLFLFIYFNLLFNNFLKKF